MTTTCYNNNYTKNQFGEKAPEWALGKGCDRVTGEKGCEKKEKGMKKKRLPCFRVSWGYAHVKQHKIKQNFIQVQEQN